MSHWTMASNGPPSSMSRPLSASVTFKLAQGPQTLIKGLCEVAGLKTNSSRPGWGTSSQCPSFPRYLHWFQSLQSGDQCRVKVSFLSALGAALCYGDGLSQGPGLELNSAQAAGWVATVSNETCTSLHKRTSLKITLRKLKTLHWRFFLPCSQRQYVVVIHIICFSSFKELNASLLIPCLAFNTRKITHIRKKKTKWWPLYRTG